MTKPLTYTCAHCGGTFDSYNDEEAHAEAVRNWGKRGDAPGMEIICDDCHRQFMAWLRKHEGVQ